GIGFDLGLGRFLGFADLGVEINFLGQQAVLAALFVLAIGLLQVQPDIAVRSGLGRQLTHLHFVGIHTNDFDITITIDADEPRTAIQVGAGFAALAGRTGFLAFLRAEGRFGAARRRRLRRPGFGTPRFGWHGLGPGIIDNFDVAIAGNVEFEIAPIRDQPYIAITAGFGSGCRPASPFGIRAALARRIAENLLANLHLVVIGVQRETKDVIGFLAGGPGRRGVGRLWARGLRSIGGAHPPP